MVLSQHRVQSWYASGCMIHQFRQAEEEGNLPESVLNGVRAMDSVFPFGGSKTVTDSPGESLGGIGRTDEGTEVLNGMVLFQHHDNDRAAAHKAREVLKERASSVNLVEVLGLFFRHAQQFHTDDAESSLGDDCDDFSREVPPDSIGFDNGKGAFGHDRFRRVVRTR